MTEADILVRALDQSGDIRNSGAARRAEYQNADMRLQRGERIVRDLGPRGGELRQQRGFARVRKADQAGIRDGAQLEHEVSLFSRRARRAFARSLIDGRFEMVVPLPATSAFAENEGISDIGKIDHMLLHSLAIFIFDKLADDQTGRHAKDAVLARPAGAELALTRVTGLGDEFAVEEKSAQAVGAVIHHEHDVAAIASVAAIRSALGPELAAMKMNDAIAALPGARKNFDMIYKHAPSIGRMGGASMRIGLANEPINLANGGRILLLLCNRTL